MKKLIECPVCENLIDSELSICPSCETDFNYNSKPKSDQKICEYCGAVNDIQSQVCTHCCSLIGLRPF